MPEAFPERFNTLEMMLHPCTPVFETAVLRSVASTGEFKLDDQDRKELMAIFGLTIAETEGLANLAVETVQSKWDQELERIQHG